MLRSASPNLDIGRAVRGHVASCSLTVSQDVVGYDVLQLLESLAGVGSVVWAIRSFLLGDGQYDGSGVLEKWFPRYCGPSGWAPDPKPSSDFQQLGPSSISLSKVQPALPE
eukprot:gnl/Spiro4/17802_TR9460_c0_g1_i1.p3 gnl/Spiro4/17802_TR9460_c0_g1~~gnl/Spiro4/17802_TR9460_c0_g1_i1.p3  ORF type:complete len:111 (+),score=12.25 gnl/Spiro4/17802_TR9460_c0_g1_i1:572-904(+)